ncbi:MAG: DUF3299 domain-containing protein [Gammaproteobacteria bacterium]|nr:DUF3299 domain-containing protein [Gammaproteobacteria bacterium]
MGQTRPRHAWSRRFVRPVAAIVALALTFGATAEDEETVRELTWEDLLPEDEALPPPVVDHSKPILFDDFPMTTIGGVVPELNGQLVKLPGFVVPLDVSGNKVASLLLVPYFGACIHQPPPPSNQIVYVEFEDPVEIRSMYDPVWITGRMGLDVHSSTLATASYSMKGRSLEKYHY